MRLHSPKSLWENVNIFKKSNNYQLNLTKIMRNEDHDNRILSLKK